MKINQQFFTQAGLSSSETKVYLALLKLGTASKRAIVKESGITSSKLYEVADKLAEKGLVSSVRHNKVLQFSAAPPEEIIEYLQRRKENIAEQQQQFEQLLPSLHAVGKPSDTDVQVFTGWKGMRTVYAMMLRSLQPGDADYVIGATSGEDTVAATRFFTKLHNQRRSKGIVLKIIVNQSDRNWAREILHDQTLDHLRLLQHAAPAEVNIWGDNVMIVLLTETPVVTLLKSKVAAKSFMNYFEQLWAIAEHP